MKLWKTSICMAVIFGYSVFVDMYSIGFPIRSILSVFFFFVVIGIPGFLMSAVFSASIFKRIDLTFAFLNWNLLILSALSLMQRLLF